jgi:hypothetical protein
VPKSGSIAPIFAWSTSPVLSDFAALTTNDAEYGGPAPASHGRRHSGPDNYAPAKSVEPLYGDGRMTEPTGQPVHLIMLDISNEMPGRVADLHSIKDDLEFGCNSAVVYYRREFEPESPRDEETHTIVNRALWSAALSAYRRAFTTGRSFNRGEFRFNLGAMRESLLSAEQQQAHDDFYDVANQHIAHRSSDRDRVLFHACLNPPPFPHGVDGVGTILVRNDGPSKPDAENFIDICRIFIAYAKQEIHSFLDEKNDDLRSRDLNQLYKQAEVQAQEQQKLIEKMNARAQ